MNTSPITGAVLAVILTAVTSGCANDAEPPAARNAPVVNTLTLTAPTPAALSQWPAQVKASDEARLAFQVPGKLIELPIREGDTVERGQVLARLDPRRWQRALDAAQAELAEAEQLLRRLATLLKQKAIPKDVYDKQRAVFEIAKAALAQQQKDLEDATLRAPFDGLVATTLVENFQSVEAKQPILRLENIAQLDLVVRLSERVAPQLGPADLRLGAAAGWAVFDAAPEQRFAVRLKAFQAAADPQTQTYKVTLTLPAPEGLGVLPGMTALVIDNLIRNDARAGFAVPVSAVNADRQLTPYVWVVNPEQQTVAQRPVTVGTLSGRQLRILDGLRAGETIVTEGSPYLLDGMTINPRAAREPEV